MRRWRDNGITCDHTVEDSERSKMGRRISCAATVIVEGELGLQHFPWKSNRLSAPPTIPQEGQGHRYDDKNRGTSNNASNSASTQPEQQRGSIKH